MALPLPNRPLAVDTDVGDYAIALAYVVQLKNEGEAIELLEVPQDAWARARAWPETLVEQIEAQEHALVEAFGVAFNTTRAHLKAAAAAVAAEAAALEAAPLAVVGIVAQLSDEAARDAAATVVRGAAEPAGVAAAAWAAPPQPQPEPATVPGVDRTRDARPLGPAQVVNVEPALDRAVVWTRPDGVPRSDPAMGETLVGTSAPLSPLRHTLPFHPGPGAPSGSPAPKEADVAVERPPAARSTDPRSLVPEGMRHFTNLGATVGPSLVRRPTLPFRHSQPTLSPFFSPPAGAADTPEAPPAGQAPRAAVEPPVDLPALSLPQYASLCVELTEPGRTVDATLARYGLSAEQRAKLDEHWQHRFAREPDVRAEWLQACVTYRAWLARNAATPEAGSR